MKLGFEWVEHGDGMGCMALREMDLIMEELLVFFESSKFKMVPPVLTP